ncbi:MAG: nucleotidyltransferase domain-containing protein [Desulfotomaculales bacterium]
MRSEREILDGLVRHLNQVCPGQVRAVILFGSRARGDAREDSDYDDFFDVGKNEAEAAIRDAVKFLELEAGPRT